MKALFLHVHSTVAKLELQLTLLELVRLPVIKVSSEFNQLCNLSLSRVSGYYEQGFLTVQRHIDRAIILAKDASAPVDNISLLMQRFTYPEYVDDGYVLLKF